MRQKPNYIQELNLLKYCETQLKKTNLQSFLMKDACLSCSPCLSFCEAVNSSITETAPLPVLASFSLAYVIFWQQ